MERRFFKFRFCKILYGWCDRVWNCIFIDDYADTPGWKGEALFSDERFKDLVLDVDKRGLQIAVHAIGDAAVNRVINAYDNARSSNGFRDARHRIEHIELIQPKDIEKLRELDIIASMQPVHPPGSDGLPLSLRYQKLAKADLMKLMLGDPLKMLGPL